MSKSSSLIPPSTLASLLTPAPVVGDTHGSAYAVAPKVTAAPVVGNSQGSAYAPAAPSASLTTGLPDIYQQLLTAGANPQLVQAAQASQGMDQSSMDALTAAENSIPHQDGQVWQFSQNAGSLAGADRQAAIDQAKQAGWITPVVGDQFGTDALKFGALVGAAALGGSALGIGGAGMGAADAGLSAALPEAGSTLAPATNSVLADSAANSAGYGASSAGAGINSTAAIGGASALPSIAPEVSAPSQLTPAQIESAVNSPGYGASAAASDATGAVSGTNAMLPVGSVPGITNSVLADSAANSPGYGASSVGAGLNAGSAVGGLSNLQAYSKLIGKVLGMGAAGGAAASALTPQVPQSTPVYHPLAPANQGAPIGKQYVAPVNNYTPNQYGGQNQDFIGQGHTDANGNTFNGTYQQHMLGQNNSLNGPLQLASGLMSPSQGFNPLSLAAGLMK